MTGTTGGETTTTASSLYVNTTGELTANSISSDYYTYNGNSVSAGDAGGEETARGRYKIDNISIEELDYGYILSVGCQKLAIESNAKLIEWIAEYTKDPNGVKQKWYDGYYHEQLQGKKKKVKK